jgi:hypothetical protein
MTVQLRQHHATRIMSFRPRRICRENLVAYRKRFFEPLEFDQSVGPILQGTYMFRIERQRSIVPGHRFIEATELAERQTKIVERVNPMSFVLQRGLVARASVFEAFERSNAFPRL